MSKSAAAAMAGPAAAGNTSAAPTDPNQLTNISAFASLLSANNHYGSDLWDVAPVVADQAELGKADAAKLAKFIKEKAELDKDYATKLKKMVVKLAIPDVPRVQDIPIPPAAAAAAAVALAASNSAAAAANPTSSSSPSPNITNAPSPTPPVDPRSSDRFMMAFRNLHMTLATNFEILSAKIVEQCFKPLSLQRDSHATSSKRLLTDLDKYTSAYHKQLDALLTARAACQKACQESDIVRRKLEAAQSQQSNAGMNTMGGVNANVAGKIGGEHVSEMIGTLKNDSATLTKRALKADALYIQSVKNMRGFRMQSDSTLSHLLDQFEQIELSRANACRDILQHYLVIQSQMFSSNLKNLTAVQSVCEKVNPSLDQQYFILKHKTGRLPIALPEYSVFRGHPQYSKAKAEEEGAMHGDISSFSSAQFEDADDGGVISSASAALQSSPPKPKSSGWGWLNTIASVVTNTSKTRASIDHDSESMLTRGSNFYERDDDTYGASNSDELSSSPVNSSSAVPRRDGDELEEEKSPERRSAEQSLADMFDSITGRVGSSTPHDPNTPPSQSSSQAHSNTVTYRKDMERDLTPIELSAAEDLLCTPAGRQAFSSVLNRQRNTHGGLKVSIEALHRLAHFTRMFLDQASASMHVAPAQLVMIMSQSFFAETGGDNESSDSPSPSSQAPSSPQVHTTQSPSKSHPHRTYLISLIKSHPIWKEMRFWEESFFFAFNTKIRQSAAARVHKWHSDLEQAESMHTRKQVCFSTLSTFSHNLSDFDMPPRLIVDFVEKLASINELEPEQLAMLRSMEAYALVQAEDEAIEREKAEEVRRNKQEQQADSSESPEAFNSSTEPSVTHNGGASSTQYVNSSEAEFESMGNNE